MEKDMSFAIGKKMQKPYVCKIAKGKRHVFCNSATSEKDVFAMCDTACKPVWLSGLQIAREM